MILSFINSLIEPARDWFELNRFSFLKFIVIPTVIVSVAWLAPRIVIGNRNPTLLFLLYLGLIAIIILLRWPMLGLLGAILGGMFIHYSGPSGLNISVAGIALLLGVWVLKSLIEQRNFQLIIDRTTIPFFAFILFSFLSFAVGQFPWFVYAQRAPLDAQLGGLSIFLLSVGAFLLAAHLIRDLFWLKSLTWIFILLGTFYVIGRAVSWGGIDRIFNLGFSAGSMFWTWLVALAFSQAVFNKRLQVGWRILLVSTVLITMYVALAQGFDWKSGWLPPLITLIAIIGFRFWRPAFVLLPLTAIPINYLANRLISTDEYSWGTRLDAWLIVLEIVEANPILGLGFSNYYWVTPLFPIRGYAVVFNSHNQYVDILAQTGLIGLTCFLWIMWEIGRLGWWLRERVPDGFPRAYVYGALGGLVGTLVAGALVDWVLPFVYNIGLTGFRASVLPWIFLGGLVSLKQMYSRESKVGQANPAISSSLSS